MVTPKLHPVGLNKAQTRRVGDNPRVIPGMWPSTERFSQSDAFILDDTTDEFERRVKYDRTLDRAASARNDRWTLRSPTLLGKLGQ